MMIWMVDLDGDWMLTESEVVNAASYDRVPFTAEDARTWFG